jgi:hypothetical protein
MNQVRTTPDSIPTGAAGTAESARCAACPHPRAAHDPIAARFCAATTSGDHSRGCACGS